MPVESVVDKTKPMVNETVRSGGRLDDDAADDVVPLDVKPELDSLDLVFRNNIKNIGLKTYENAYEATRIGRKILSAETLTTETNIIDI